MFQWTNTPAFRDRQLPADEFHRQVIAKADAEAALRAGSPPVAAAPSRQRPVRFAIGSTLVRFGELLRGKPVSGSLT